LSLIGFLLFIPLVDHISGQTSENFLHVSFENNVSPSFEIQLNSDEKFILKQSHSWIRDQNSRYNLYSYSLDGQEFIPISRQARGVFSLDIAPDSSHSVVFSAVIQYPISIEGVKHYTFSPKSPTNDNWFDAQSEILISDIVSNNTGVFPQDISSWDGSILNESGNSVLILVDKPINLNANWETNYAYLGLLIIPIFSGILLFVKKRGSTASKTALKHEKIPSKANFEQYDLEIEEYLTKKYAEKLDFLIKSKTITTDKGSKLKENL
jgi:hypothetical protein